MVTAVFIKINSITIVIRQCSCRNSLVGVELTVPNMDHVRPPPELQIEGSPAARADAWRKR